MTPFVEITIIIISFYTHIKTAVEHLKQDCQEITWENVDLQASMNWCVGWKFSIFIQAVAWPFIVLFFLYLGSKYILGKVWIYLFNRFGRFL